MKKNAEAALDETAKYLFIYLPISREDKGEREGIPHTHPIP